MSNLSKQLKNLDISKLKLKNGTTVEKELRRHASILADCIMEELNKVYDSYEPKVYKRSYKLYDSLIIDGKAHVDVSAHGANLSIGLHFDDNAIYRGFDGEQVNIAILLNEGWQTHGQFKNVPYLGFREGTHFIDKGIEQYKKRVSSPFMVRFTFNDVERIY